MFLICIASPQKDMRQKKTSPCFILYLVAQEVIDPKFKKESYMQGYFSLYRACLRIYIINLIRNVDIHNISNPHNIGIQYPALSVLLTPIITDIAEIKIRYKVKSARKSKRKKRASFFIMKSYLQSFDRGILPPFLCFRQFLYSF